MLDKNVAVPTNLVEIPDSEIALRRKKVIAAFAEKGCKAMIFFSARSVFYLTGCQVSATERPMAFILREDGTSAMMLPHVEYDFATKVLRGVDRIMYYPEYPMDIHPMVRLTNFLKELNLSSGNIAADGDGYPTIWGYRGPPLSSLNPDINFTFLPFMMEEIQIIKTPFDISVIKECARWGCLTHTLLREYTVPGLTEDQIITRVNLEATTIMRKTLGEISMRYAAPVARAMFGGQIGKDCYFPHALPNIKKVQMGDHVVTGATGDMLGYWSELERTMFVGEPNPDQIKYYNHAVAIQEVALNMMKPGNTCADVDREVKRYYKENGLEENWRHHTGHGLGFTKGGDGGHELPFLDEGQTDVVLTPGMCFSVEPGVYVKGVGSFRVSDSILITETGSEKLTYWPKELDQIICGR